MRRDEFLKAAALAPVAITLLPAGAKGQWFGGPAYAKVAELSGKIWIGEKEAALGDKAAEGEKVRTGEDSSAVLKLSDESVMMLRPETTVVVPSEDNGGALGLIAGAILSVFSSGDRAVKTPTSVAGVRGTGLYASVESEQRTYLCTCFGKVDHFALNTPSINKTVEATHHAGLYIEGGGLKPAIKQAGMKEHTDEELRKLFAHYETPYSRWGRGRKLGPMPEFGWPPKK